MASRLPSLTAPKIIKILKRNGFLLDHVTGSHYVFYRPETGLRVTVAYHTRSLPRGTLMAIIKQSGLDLDLFW